MYTQDARHPRPSHGLQPPPIPSSSSSAPPQLRRGKSILARDEDYSSPNESGLALFKRGNTLRRKNAGGQQQQPSRSRSQRRAAGLQDDPAQDAPKQGFWNRIAPGPVGGWMIYCWLLTCLVPGFVLRGVFGACWLARLLASCPDALTPPLWLPSDDYRQAHAGSPARVAREDGPAVHHPAPHGL